MDDRGATAIEYALVLSIMGTLLISAFPAIGADILSAYNSIADDIIDIFGGSEGDDREIDDDLTDP